MKRSKRSRNAKKRARKQARKRRVVKTTLLTKGAFVADTRCVFIYDFIKTHRVASVVLVGCEFNIAGSHALKPDALPADLPRADLYVIQSTSDKIMAQLADQRPANHQLWIIPGGQIAYCPVLRTETLKTPIAASLPVVPSPDLPTPSGEPLQEPITSLPVTLPEPIASLPVTLPEPIASLPVTLLTHEPIAPILDVVRTEPLRAPLLIDAAAQPNTSAELSPESPGLVMVGDNSDDDDF